MPLYEYKCKDCGKVLEVIQKSDDEPLSGCPDCGTPTLVRCISVSGFRLSGDGYYETDEKPKDKQKNIASNDNN